MFNLNLNHLYRLNPLELFLELTISQMSSSVRGFSSDPKLIHRVREVRLILLIFITISKRLNPVSPLYSIFKHIEGLEEHEDVDEIAYALQQKFP